MWLRCGVMPLALGAWVATVLAEAPATPKADAAKGQQIASQVCSTCHAADGNSTIPGNPKLAQQHSAYLVKQLTDYTVRNGEQKPARENPIMNGIAPSLSEQDRRDVAAWFSGQEQKPGTARNKDTLELGQRIFRAGLPEKALPACSGCHNPTGAGIPNQYPRLGGQHAEYVEATLKAFRDGTRRNNVPMQQIAARLSDAEMRAVADYIQGLRR
ncbi:MAG TPA: cytochrome c [Burkholderiaceae bacterium]|nr:cytochrome c [Burkholderiaceae bacterium]